MGIEPITLRLLSVCSNQMSYKGIIVDSFDSFDSYPRFLSFLTINSYLRFLPILAPNFYHLLPSILTQFLPIFGPPSAVPHNIIILLFLNILRIIHL